MKHTEDKRSAIEARITTLRARGERIEAHHAVESRDALADPVDRAQLHDNDEVVAALGASVEHDIAALDAALARIDAGTYGVCSRCHRPIAPERLALLPATPFCERCATAR